MSKEVEKKIKMDRAWGMPNSETFQISPIEDFLWRYLKEGMEIVDPFARNNTFATRTNDINPDTKAQCHMDALDYLKMLVESELKADIVLFDPPYSLRQVKEMYNSMGVEKLSMTETQRVGRWTEEKNQIDILLKPGGYVLSFGWHSNGMGKKRGYEIKEILLVAHGSAHNDTICIAEQNIPNLFEANR